MNLDIFLPDYGTLPSKYFERSAISNPVELFWSDDLKALLRMAGESEEAIGERASDFDRFLSICRVCPLLVGHPTLAWIKSVFKEHFGMSALPTEKNAKAAWGRICESLLQSPILPRSLVSGAWLCDELKVSSNLPGNITPVLNADLLLYTNSKNAAAWSTEIASTVEHFVKNRCEKIVLRIPDDFDFASPSLYHVDRILSVAKRDRQAANILICQLVRELSTVAQKYDLLLVLKCNGQSKALARLLSYVEESVGLPLLCWSLCEAKEALQLLDFTAKPHKSEILVALPYEAVMTENELLEAIKSWQARYPVGKLCFLTARDLRQSPYARAHIADMLESIQTKI